MKRFGTRVRLPAPPPISKAFRWRKVFEVVIQHVSAAAATMAHNPISNLSPESTRKHPFFNLRILWVVIRSQTFELRMELWVVWVAVPENRETKKAFWMAASSFGNHGGPPHGPSSIERRGSWVSAVWGTVELWTRLPAGSWSSPVGWAASFSIG